ncbi:hypothetical protein P4U99_01620 [Brevibacillus agri]|uniref:hypothetical protein n=1 Tax=Brevibacillus agri TaxID=51101 RepID=UPI002E211D65|nr:hypothetical protein [Brevibacillus agri]MED1655114.1 hypothetical protein [Brevibacillus agri]MED1687806.1 hypothetical protein [Brevibacillus agri]MED1692991.1 hypothetical protein [Brevibacillus agri]MED1698131.1 hypothetical protein [Brevibacillus agri]
MTLLKSFTSSLLGTAVLLTAATAPVLAASPAATAKPVPAVQAQKPKAASGVHPENFDRQIKRVRGQGDDPGH